MKIMIKCWGTGEVVSTGMVTDQPTWTKLANNWEGVRFLCPACNVMHAWTKSDAFLVCGLPIRHSTPCDAQRDEMLATPAAASNPPPG